MVMNDMSRNIQEARKAEGKIASFKDGSWGKVEYADAYNSVYEGPNDRVVFLVRESDGSAQWVEPREITSAWAHKFDW